MIGSPAWVSDAWGAALNGRGGAEEPSCWEWDGQTAGGKLEVQGLLRSALRSSWEPLSPCSSCGTLALLTMEGWKVPSPVNDFLSAAAPPTERDGVSGGWSNGKAAARRDNLPPALLPGAPGNTPSRLATRAVSARPLGLADPSSIPPGLGESPRPDSLSHPCHFSSAALFPLSASYTLQRLHRKAWLPLRPLPRPLLGPRCPAGRGCLHNRVPLGPVPESRPTAWVVECTVRGRALFVIPWFLVFGVEGPRLWAHAPLLSR